MRIQEGESTHHTQPKQQQQQDTHQQITILYVVL